MQKPDLKEITEWFKSIQDSICTDLETLDEKGQFKEDNWSRAEGGGGRTRIIEDGNVIQKGGVNFSHVHGMLPIKALKALNIPHEEQATEAPFQATGVSIVLHPQNPMVPIIHMNIRYFEMNENLWWFGGGIDLTPHYINRDDATFFHKGLKTTCDKHHPSYYLEFKHWADRYFYIPHRQETRGIGGIFFDRLADQDGFTKAQRWSFVQDIGRLFSQLYVAIAKKNHQLPYGEQEKKWQSLRRGRYVEFNLVWDRGTKFGLETNGRTESILMSLPKNASWEYMHTPKAGSAEAETLDLLKQGIDWHLK